jgi:LysM repeat protein
VQPAARAAAKKPEAEAPVKKPTGPLRLHEVQRGQRLGSIAKRYKVTVSALCYANAIEARAPIKPGQLLIVPPPDDVGGRYARKQLERGALEATLKARGESGKAAAERRTKQAPSASSSWKPYVKPPWRRGYVNVVGYHKSFKGYVIGKNGVIIGRARKEISSILTPMGRRPPIDSRLIKLLARVSDTFGGRPLRVVSGYRGSSYVKGSRHKSGRAVDFSVIGVPNEVLRDFLRTLDKVGVGYYPNSSFVHLDVRDYPAYWVDYSGPGEAPRYRQRRAPSKDRTSKAPALPAAAMDHDEPVEAPAGTEEALAGTGASSTENSQSSSQTGTPSP